MSPAMVLTRAVMSSMKRSGKRFLLVDCRRSVKYKWWIMLLTWKEKEHPFFPSQLQMLHFWLNEEAWGFMILVVLTISSKKNQACCRAPSLTLPLLTTHCRASSSWKSWEEEGTIKEPFTIKNTAFRSVCLSSTMGYETVLWHKVHCVAARVGRIHYSTDPTLNTDKHPIRTQYPLPGQDQQCAPYHKRHIIPSSNSLQVHS